MKTIQSILVATDLGETSDVVVRAAAGLASLLSATLHVLHSLDFDVAPYAATGREPRFGDRHEAAERALREQIARTVPPDVEVGSSQVQAYVAHRAILETASGFDVGLIVLGPHGQGSLLETFLGSTADHVIRSADVPCLVVRGPLSLPLRHVIVPIDLSESAQAALDLALNWATALRASPDRPGGMPRISVVHVVPTTFAVEGFPFDREVIAPELHREVEAALARAGDAIVPELREDVRWGDDPAAEVLRMIETEKADLVVMATHGYGALRRALIGSVAAGIARSAACPVLLVPPPLWSEKAKREGAADEPTGVTGSS